MTHGAVQMYLYADNCDHPEPENSESREWEEWAADHQSGRDGPPICILTPLGTACPACTEEVADEEDLAEGEFVACRLPGKASANA